MLMFNRITNINENKGKFNKGLIEAELDIEKKMWFFDCHFKEDPVMPGCLRIGRHVAIGRILFRMERGTWKRKSSRSKFC